MLPKVANQLLQHTSRAVTAVQNQTGHTIRNVLQFQSSSSPSPAKDIGNWNGSTSSSSGRGSSGPGAGGAKFHSSRFNTNYSAIGRAITQADPSISSGTRGELSDESEEFRLIEQDIRPVNPRTRARLRSSSLSFTIQDQDGSTSRVGVLRAIQSHVRARHAFATATTQKTLPSASSTQALDAPYDEDDVQDSSSEAEVSAITRIRALQQFKDPSLVLAEMQSLQASQGPLSAKVYNTALLVLQRIMQKGNSLRSMLKLYNEMTAASIVPNGHTYMSLLKALMERDLEVSRLVSSLQPRLGLYPKSSQSGSMLEDRLGRLKAEDNYSPALALFQTACQTPGLELPANVYNYMLQTSANHSDVDTAAHIFSLMEQNERIRPDVYTFRMLLTAYTTSGDLVAAREVFDAFLASARLGRLRNINDADDITQRITQLGIWNDMISAYIRLGQPGDGLAILEEMMDKGVGDNCAIVDIPAPSPLTFTRIMEAFCSSGDVNSALVWFNRLLQQDHVSERDARTPHNEPTKPAQSAWRSMIKWLSVNGMVDELRRLTALAESENLYEIHGADRLFILRANITHLRAHPELSSVEVVSTLDYLHSLLSSTEAIQGIYTFSHHEATEVFQDVCNLYLEHGRPDRALELTERLVEPLHTYFEWSLASSKEQAARRRTVKDFVWNVVRTFGVLASPTGVWSVNQAARLARVCLAFAETPSKAATTLFLHSYISSSSAEKDTLTVQDWETLFTCIATASNGLLATVDPVEIFQEGISRGVRFADLQPAVVGSIVRFLRAFYEPDERKAVAKQLGLEQDLVLPIPEAPPSPTASISPSAAETSSAPSTPVIVDSHLSQSIDQFSHLTAKITPLEAYSRFEAGLAEGRYPTPAILGRLINAIGRLGHVDKVHVLYDAAQRVLESMGKNKQAQAAAWLNIEDQMIVALAHAGDLDAAHVYRQRILMQGGCPSADAYGVLIQHIKDTTDDTSNALALYNEAIARGLRPNVYLYNIIISKLAKARKADHALEIFGMMKSRAMQATSVTYGALIAACCRVGDAASAETLFAEMSNQANFRPRIPPYNTMMQLYTQTKPDRERVLHYYEELKKSNIKPTAHTYKLLLDAYGTIEPADPQAMEAVFAQLLADPHVEVNGTHWSALINAWGCVQKDLDKAISIFESVQTQPSRTSLPDAVMFEALINVFVTLRRPDLIPIYVAKLPEYGVHMTAYIANIIIKGYAMAGDITQARAVFESLADPPEGIAAPNNHAPHDGQRSSSVPADAPVYREPSTWEAMVRAELANGNRDEAVALLERVQARQFPPAVYNRISGIMLDDSVSPWSQSAGSSTPETPAQ